MKVEFDAMIRNNTWTLVQRPPDKQMIGSRWIFRVKKLPIGLVENLMSKVVAKGFHEVLSFDFKETFSLVVKPITIHIIITSALARQWILYQLNVNNVFYNGHLQEEVYKTQSLGFEDLANPDYVCELNKAIFGLKQTIKSWFDILSNALCTMGFIRSKIDFSLFFNFHHSIPIYLLVYVNDIITIGRDEKFVSYLIKHLNLLLSH